MSEPASSRIEANGAAHRNTRPKRLFRPNLSLVRLLLVTGLLAAALWLMARWPGQTIAWLTVAKDTAAQQIGFLWIGLLTLFLVFCVICFFMAHRRDRFGGAGQKPQLNFVAWCLAIFIAGTATGLVVWAAAEPLRHLDGNPLIDKADYLTGKTIPRALGLTMFHWGLHVWAVFSLTGLAIAQASYRRGLPLRLSSALYPVLGRDVRRMPGILVDVLVLLAALFVLLPVLAFSLIEIEALLKPFTGHADTAGLLSEARSSIERGARIAADGDRVRFEAFLAKRLPIPPNVIYFHAGLAAIATLALALGLRQGVRWLVLAASIALAATVLLLLIAGPTRSAAAAMVAGAVSYFRDILPEALSPLRDEQMRQWQAWWTVWSWGGWIALAPIVGAFLARISRGRTVRQYLVATLIVPTVLSILLIGLLGGAATQLELFGPGGLVGVATTAPQLVLPEAIDAMTPSLFGIDITFIRATSPYVAFLLPTLVLVAAFTCWSSALGGYFINQRDSGPASVLNAMMPVLIGGAVSGLWLSGSISALNASRSAGFLLSLLVGLLLVLVSYCAIKLLRRARQRISRLDPARRIG